MLLRRRWSRLSSGTYQDTPGLRSPAAQPSATRRCTWHRPVRTGLHRSRRGCSVRCDATWASAALGHPTHCATCTSALWPPRPGCGPPDPAGVLPAGRTPGSARPASSVEVDRFGVPVATQSWVELKGFGHLGDAHRLPVAEDGIDIVGASLSGITAAVVGVIANLAVFFALHTLFRDTIHTGWGPIELELPVLATINPVQVGVALIAAGLLFELKMSVLRNPGHLRSTRAHRGDRRPAGCLTRRGGMPTATRTAELG